MRMMAARMRCVWAAWVGKRVLFSWTTGDDWRLGGGSAGDDGSAGSESGGDDCSGEGVLVGVEAGAAVVGVVVVVDCHRTGAVNNGRFALPWRRKHCEHRPRLVPDRAGE